MTPPSTKSTAWAFKSCPKEGEEGERETVSPDSWPPGDGEMFGLGSERSGERRTKSARWGL